MLGSRSLGSCEDLGFRVSGLRVSGFKVPWVLVKGLI